MVLGKAKPRNLAGNQRKKKERISEGLGLPERRADLG